MQRSIDTMSQPISIHALLAESDSVFFIIFNASCTFLSTLSLRRATAAAGAVSYLLSYFYPRSPCGERRSNGGTHYSYIYFYPRSPCGERPNVYGGVYLCIVYFYPRSPCGERLFFSCNYPLELFISIHALLAESDFLLVKILVKSHNFYPRSPCGERPLLVT